MKISKYFENVLNMFSINSIKILSILEDPSNYTDIPIYPNWPKFFPIIYLEKDILDNEGLLMVKIYALSIVFTLIQPLFNVAGMVVEFHWNIKIYINTILDFFSPFVLIFLLYRPFYFYYRTGKKNFSHLWFTYYLLYFCWVFIVSTGNGRNGILGLSRLLYYCFLGWNDIGPRMCIFVSICSAGRLITHLYVISHLISVRIKGR